MKNHAPAFLRLVEDARSRIQEIHVQEVKRRLDNGLDFFLIDVREEDEWKRGHLPHAAHLCKGVIERDIEKAVPDKSAPIVLYCGGGFRSALAADSLQKMGYLNVLSLQGGWSGWEEAGFSTVGPSPVRRRAVGATSDR
jgi:rhodanese-related sulfurtransferase